MQIEEGKFYVTRSGRTVGPAAKQDSQQWPWHIRGAGSFGNDGRFNGKFDDAMDLMSEKFVTPGELPTPYQKEALTIAMEEGFEVLEELHRVLTAIGKRASKCIRFGLDEVQPGQDLTNKYRLSMECGDLQAVVDVLKEAGAVDVNVVSETAAAKRKKLQKYMQQDPG